VFGFFALANEECMKMFRPGLSAVTYHCVYKTTIQCTSSAVFPAMLCVYSPFNNVTIPDNTMASMSAKAFIPTAIPGDTVLLEGICVAVVPGDPASDTHEHFIPNLPYPMVVGWGLVTAQAQTLPDGMSKAFGVISTDYV
ncbi:hypothetical protein EDD17DRAFT_1420330, partial [Pisolithus thermaeus]